ncbi:DUF3293 domain-containing protein [Aestuariibacter salexigens]|uniref:DUF3293 domain-containing protein n=1 Tax=Aestuariibacter salexigens TaxID=226010 RepID=UPI0004155717|nr:DUF3293 domain-containing protein [Aestuariibacter salexigens]
MQRHSQKLWNAYKTTRFQWLEAEPLWTRFAIITAWNPRSRVTPASINKTRQSVLMHRLSEEGIKYRHILAGNPDFSYSEASLAVRTDKVMAALLCQELEQNAYFWVQEGELTLLPVMFDLAGAAHLGAFQDRVQT